MSRTSTSGARYAGRNGFVESTCLMSMSSSSWCCCSWCSPSSTSARRSESIESIASSIARSTCSPVTRDLLDTRPGQQAPLGTRMPRTDRFVVRVEEVAVVRVELAIARNRTRQHERFEEPRRVGPVPLRRADVGHRLDGLVLARERCGESLGVRADFGVARRERRAADGVIFTCARREDPLDRRHAHPRVTQAASQSWLRGGADQVCTLANGSDICCPIAGGKVTRIAPPLLGDARVRASMPGRVPAYTRVEVPQSDRSGELRATNADAETGQP